MVVSVESNLPESAKREESSTEHGAEQYVPRDFDESRQHQS